MNPFVTMSSNAESFTPNEMTIYKAILANPEQVTYYSIDRLAEEIGVSQPAITRFIKRLGYDKYRDFRSDISASLARKDASDDSRLSYFRRFELLLKNTEAMLTDEYMKGLADYVLSHKRIFASGIGKSGQPAQLMRNILWRYGITVDYISYDLMNEFIEGLTADDLLIIFSVSAQTRIMEIAKASSAKIMLVTTNAAHKYQDVTDRTVVLPFLPPSAETSSVSPVLFDMFVELLSSYIAKRTTVDAEQE
ncbi:MAG: MurR/RpiR family transcriptional regulator [Bulleidia sp.]|nr:MurR/RpiR family transcriptional regulator [Bulleidia sp.]